MTEPSSICPECGHIQIIMSLASRATQLIQPNASTTTPIAELALVCPYCGFVSQMQTPDPADRDDSSS